MYLRFGTDQTDLHPEATLFTIENSVGYQMDFYPPLVTDNLDNAEYGTDGHDTTALRIAQSGNDLLAGNNIEGELIWDCSDVVLSGRIQLYGRQ